jgi:hypothetical protein
MFGYDVLHEQKHSQAPMPRAIDTIKENDALKHKAVISSKKAVAGNPHNTPNATLL